MQLLSVLFGLISIVVFLVGLIAMIFLLRNRMIDGEIEIAKISNVQSLSKKLQKGDIVYMCSRSLAWSDFYVAMLNVAASTPYFHVFLVLDKDRMAHFVHKQYDPQGESYCTSHPESYLRTLPLMDFLASRQRLRPLYKIYRRDAPFAAADAADFEPFLSCEGTCFLGFSGILSTLFSSSKTQFHCNSFVGTMLMRMNLLHQGEREELKAANSFFTPARMQQVHLPAAGFENVENFITTSAM